MLIIAAFIYAELYEIAVRIAQIDALHSATRAHSRHDAKLYLRPFAFQLRFELLRTLIFADEAKIRRARDRTRCKRRKLARAGVDIDLRRAEAQAVFAALANML